MYYTLIQVNTMSIRTLLSSHERFFIFLFALIFTSLTTSDYISQYLRRPKDHVFVGMIHYFEDYYYYLDQFYQGKEGRWTTLNRFTPEPLPPTPIYLHNVLLGKAGGYIGLEPYQTYGISVILIKIVYILLAYEVLRFLFPNSLILRITALLLFSFSSAFPDIIRSENGWELNDTVTIFRAKNRIMSRFGNVPNDLLANVEMLGVILLLFRLFFRFFAPFAAGKQVEKLFIPKNFMRYILPVLVILPLLTLADAAKALIACAVFPLLACSQSSILTSRAYRIRTVLVTSFLLLTIFAVSFYLGHTISMDPVYTSALLWDVASYRNQIQQASVRDWVWAFGMLGILFVVSVPYLIRIKKTPYETVALAMSLFTFTGFFLPYFLGISFPGFRFLPSAAYIYIAGCATVFLAVVKKRFGFRVFALLITGILALNSINFTSSVIRKTAPVQEPDYHFTYIPDSLYEGLMAIRNAPGENTIVLANPHTAMDLYIPGITGKKTYSGHFLTTLHAGEKDKSADEFFYKWTDPLSAKDFLKSNAIQYVFFTRYDGEVGQLVKDYPFLTVYYQNDMATVFTYQ